MFSTPICVQSSIQPIIICDYSDHIFYWQKQLNSDKSHSDNVHKGEYWLYLK